MGDDFRKEEVESIYNNTDKIFLQGVFEEVDNNWNKHFLKMLSSQLNDVTGATWEWVSRNQGYIRSLQEAYNNYTENVGEEPPGIKELEEYYNKEYDYVAIGAEHVAAKMLKKGYSQDKFNEIQLAWQTGKYKGNYNIPLCEGETDKYNYKVLRHDEVFMLYPDLIKNPTMDKTDDIYMSLLKTDYRLAAITNKETGSLEEIVTMERKDKELELKGNIESDELYKAIGLKILDSINETDNLHFVKKDGELIVQSEEKESLENSEVDSEYRDGVIVKRLEDITKEEYETLKRLERFAYNYDSWSTFDKLTREQLEEHMKEKKDIESTKIAMGKDWFMMYTESKEETHLLDFARFEDAIFGVNENEDPYIKNEQKDNNGRKEMYAMLNEIIDNSNKFRLEAIPRSSDMIFEKMASKGEIKILKDEEIEKGGSMFEKGTIFKEFIIRRPEEDEDLTEQKEEYGERVKAFNEKYNIEFKKKFSKDYQEAVKKKIVKDVSRGLTNEEVINNEAYR